MTWSFRSVGSIGTAFNAAMTPGAPPGFQGGDLLATVAWCVAGSVTIPDLTAQNFTQLSVNSVISYAVIWGCIASSASQAMPTFQLGPDFQGCYCAAYTGAPASLTGIAAQVANERATSSTSGISFPAIALPPASNILVLGVGMRNAGSANGVSFGSLASFTTRAIQVQNSRPHAVLVDWIQTAATAQGISVISSSPADSASLNAAAELVYLLSAAPSGMPTGDIEDGTISQSTLRRKATVQEFWQVPITLRQTVPNIQPTFIPLDIYVPLLRNNMRAQTHGEQNLLQSTLFGKDRVLIPASWDYEWDKPVLIAALQYAGQGFDASDMTNLTNYAPYLEYNWAVPPGPRQWSRSYEASFNLNLRGQDNIPLGALHNLQQDPPPPVRQPIANRSYEQKALSLFYTVPTKPPLCGEWSLPLRPRRPITDFIQGVPLPQLVTLSTRPPFGGWQDSPPPARRLPAALLSYEYSRSALLRGQDIVPFGLRSEQQNIKRVYRSVIYTIAHRNPFLIPIVPPPPTGTGVHHVGRIVIPPGKLGDDFSIPFDFISGLTPGVVLTSATVTATLYSGTDPSPQSIIDGPASVSGTIAFQPVKPTILGNVYDLSCAGVTSSGETVILDAYYAVVPGVP